MMKEPKDPRPKIISAEGDPFGHKKVLTPSDALKEFKVAVDTWFAHMNPATQLMALEYVEEKTPKFEGF